MGSCSTGVAMIFAELGVWCLLTDRPTLEHVISILLDGLFDVPGVAGWELDVLLRGGAGLQLAPALELGAELSVQEQREVGQPEPQQEDDNAGQSPVGLVVG